jgi:hypothetical protein
MLVRSNPLRALPELNSAQELSLLRFQSATTMVTTRIARSSKVLRKASGNWIARYIHLVISLLKSSQKRSAMLTRHSTVV